MACQMINMKAGVPAGFVACSKAKIGAAVWLADRKKAKLGRCPGLSRGGLPHESRLSIGVSRSGLLHESRLSIGVAA